jgi:hypothetical protein
MADPRSPSSPGIGAEATIVRWSFDRRTPVWGRPAVTAARISRSGRSTRPFQATSRPRSSTTRTPPSPSGTGFAKRAEKSRSAADPSRPGGRSSAATPAAISSA